MKNFLAFIGISVLLLSGCTSGKQSNEQLTTIDSTLQNQLTASLKTELSDSDLLYGEVIVMETQTGYVKALVRLTRTDSTDFVCSEEQSDPRTTGLMKPISALAALETGKVKLSDTVNIGSGVYRICGRTIEDPYHGEKDTNKVTLTEGLLQKSNVATYKTVNRAFGEDAGQFLSQLDKMGYGKPDSIQDRKDVKPIMLPNSQSANWTNTSLFWISFGYEQKISPLQMLTFYNAIANNGKMIAPQFFQKEPSVIRPQIAKSENVKSMQRVFKECIIQKMKNLKHNDVAGYYALVNTINVPYCKDFCGYFPVNAPKYSVFISIGGNNPLIPKEKIAGILNCLKKVYINKAIDKQ